MDRKKVIFAVIVVTLIALVAGYVVLRERSIVGRFVDAKVVRVVPQGFIHLPKLGGNWDNGMRYVSWESQLWFFDVNGTVIYQTVYSNSDFIVKHKNEYYVNEEKFLELVDIANSAFEKRNQNE